MQTGAASTVEAVEPGAVSAVRQILLRRLVDIAALPANTLASSADRDMAGDILIELLMAAPDRERVVCAERLAQSAEAPRRVLRYLAQASFDVAAVILEQNTALDAVDLEDVVRNGSSDHRVAVAGRRRVYASTAQALIKSGDLTAMRVLLRNQGASLSQASMDELVTLSQTQTALCRLLIERSEITPSQALAIFWWADGATRRRILQVFAADRKTLIDNCSDLFGRMTPVDWRDPMSRKSMQLIDRRQRNRQALAKSPYDSLEDAITAAAGQGMTAQLVQEIAYLCGVKPGTLAKMLSDAGGEGLAVVCKATGLRRPYFEKLWQSLRRPTVLADGTLEAHYERILYVYQTLSVVKAQSALRYWDWSFAASFTPQAPPSQPHEGGMTAAQTAP